MIPQAHEEPNILTRFAAWLFPIDAQGANGPLARVVWRQANLLPAILLLGLLASLLEGFGIGLLIPLVAFITDTGMPAHAPAPIRQAMARVQGFSGVDTTVMLGVVIVGVILVKGLVQVANARLISKVDTQAGHDVRTAISRRLLALDYRFFLEHDASRLVKILTIDVWYGMEAMGAYLGSLVALGSISVFAVLLVWLDWKLFAIVLVCVALIRAVHFLLEQRTRRLGNLITSVNEPLGAQIMVLINAARPIRIYSQQAAEQQRFEKASSDIGRALEQVGRASAWASPTVEFLFALVFVAIIIATKSLGWSLATVTAFLVLLYRSQPHLAAFTHARVLIASRQGSLGELEWLLSQAPAPPPEVRRAKPLRSLDAPIAFRNVNYRYPNGMLALNDASFVIRPGATTALIGRSGSGKSTLVNLVCRLLRPDAGEILLGDEPVDNFALTDWLGRIALAGQDIELVSGTVAFNIAYGDPGAGAERIAAAAHAASAHEFIERLPGRYNALVGEEGISLSSGQRQRIGIARALLRRPDLLILDEATSAVDAIAENEIMRLLSERSHFRTAIVISHNRGTLSACTDGIVLENGFVREAGPLSRLRYFEEMTGNQA